MLAIMIWYVVILFGCFALPESDSRQIDDWRQQVEAGNGYRGDLTQAQAGAWQDEAAGPLAATPIQPVAGPPVPNTAPAEMPMLPQEAAAAVPPSQKAPGQLVSDESFRDEQAVPLDLVSRGGVGGAGTEGRTYDRLVTTATLLELSLFSVPIPCLAVDGSSSRKRM